MALGGHFEELVIALFLKLKRQFFRAGFDDFTLEENVHLIRDDIVEQAAGSA